VEYPAGLNRSATLFAGITIGAGAAVLSVCVGHLLDTAIDLRLIIIAVLALVSGAAVLRLPSVPATFSFGDAFSFSALFLYGPAAGAVVAALDSLAGGLRLPALSRTQRAFNVAAPAVSMWAAGTIVFDMLGRPLPGAALGLADGLASSAMAAGLFVLLGTALVATAIAMEKTTAPFQVWKSQFGLWLDPIAGAYVGFVAAFYSRDLGIAFVMLMVPIPLVLYNTLRPWIGRADRFNISRT